MRARRGVAMAAMLGVDRGFVDAGDKKRTPLGWRVFDARRSPSPASCVRSTRRPSATAFTPEHGPGQPLWFSLDIAGTDAQSTSPRAIRRRLMLIAETSADPDRTELETPAPVAGRTESRGAGYAPQPGSGRQHSVSRPSAAVADGACAASTPLSHRCRAKIPDLFSTSSGRGRWSGTRCGQGRRRTEEAARRGSG